MNNTNKRQKVIQLKPKPKCIVKSKNISTIKGTGTVGAGGSSNKIKIKTEPIVPVLVNEEPLQEIQIEELPEIMEELPEPVEGESEPEPEIFKKPSYDQFKLDDGDEIINKVLQHEVDQRGQDVLLGEETDTRGRINKRVAVRAQPRIKGRPQPQAPKVDPTTGMVIKMKSRTHPTLNPRENFQTKKLLQQESQAQIPIFKGISECLPLGEVPDIRTVNLDDIPAFCLHLSDRPDREEFMANNLPKIHNNVKWIEGVKLRPSYKGIARAHKRIIAIAKAKGWPYVITFEDDIKIPSLKSKGAFAQAMKNLPKDWDALLGGVYDCKSYEPMGNGLAKVRGWCSLHCVLWKYTIYDAILNHHEKSHIDRYIGSLHDKHFYMTWPFVAIQYNGFSDNVERDVNYDRFLERYKILS